MTMYVGAAANEVTTAEAEAEAEVRELPNKPSEPAPAPSVPSIASSAMMVELSISVWTGRKKDKKASEDVTRQNYAATGVASVNKKLLADCAELVTVQKLTAAIRTLHASMTMPWSDSGMRLIPTAQYFKYHQQMDGMRQEWEARVDEFLNAYDWEISVAQTSLGDLFDRDEYPTREALEGKFAFRLNYIPLPDAGDFRVDIGNDAMAQIKTHYEDYYSRQLTSAMNDVWQRTYKALGAMSERLDYAADDKKKVFRDSLVENVVGLIDLLNVCNVTNDVQMAAMARTLDMTMRGVTPEALREDDTFRRDVKQQIDDTIATLPSLDL